MAQTKREHLASDKSMQLLKNYKASSFLPLNSSLIHKQPYSKSTLNSLRPPGRSSHQNTINTVTPSTSILKKGQYSNSNPYWSSAVSHRSKPKQ